MNFHSCIFKAKATEDNLMPGSVFYVVQINFLFPMK